VTNTPTVNYIKSANATIRMLNEDIFYVLYDEHVVIEVSDFEETSAIYQALSHDKKLKFLVEFPLHTTATPEARKWAEENQVDTSAEAIVFYGLPQRMIIRFYLIFRKQTHPVKTFGNRDKALIWLKYFKA